MRLVVVESPYAGDVAVNLAYLRAAMADCLSRDEAPYASHALYTQDGVLDDDVPAERKKGMQAGFTWGAKAALRVVYVDRGVSRGMITGMKEAIRLRQPLVFRSLQGRTGTIDVAMEGGPYAVAINEEWTPPDPYETLQMLLSEQSQVVPRKTIVAWTKAQRDGARAWCLNPTEDKPRHLQGFEQLNLLGMDVKIDPDLPEGTAELRAEDGEVLGRLENVGTDPSEDVMHWFAMGGSETVCGIYSPSTYGIEATMEQDQVTCGGCRARMK